MSSFWRSVVKKVVLFIIDSVLRKRKSENAQNSPLNESEDEKPLGSRPGHNKYWREP